MLPALAYLTLGSMIIPLQAAPLNKLEDDESSVWYLAMNLNPADGHVMDYTTGKKSWENFACDHELKMYVIQLQNLFAEVSLMRVFYPALKSECESQQTHSSNLSSGWSEDKFIGTYRAALSQDYLNRFTDD